MIDTPALLDAATRFGLDATSARPLTAGTRNRSVLIAGNAVLTFLFQRQRAEIAQLLAAARLARASGLLVPRYRQQFFRLDTRFGPAWVIASDYLPGKCGSLRPATPSQLGESLARLHRHGPAPASWQPRTTSLEARLAGFDALPKGLDACVQSALLIERSGLLDLADTTFGHFDLFPDNTLVQPDGTLAMTDWETAGPGCALLDLAICAVGHRPSAAHDNETWLQVLLDGYAAAGGEQCWSRMQLATAMRWAATSLALERYRMFDLARRPFGRAGSYAALLPLARAS
ncbi:MAG: phosphotransferase [Gammaproteobacteria bacterium]|nr:phosphotransferase [Gammaproteobacteria bacterium]